MKRKFLSIMTTLVMVISLVGVLPTVTASAGGSLGVGIGETITYEAYDVEMYCISYDSNLIECSNCEMDNDIGYAIVSWSGGEDGYFTVFGQEEGLFEITVYTTDNNYYVLHAGVADSDYNNDDYYNDDDYNDSDNNTYTELVLGENITITTSDYDYVNYYSYTPEISGMYYFLCDSYIDINVESDYGNSFRTSNSQYNLEAGEEYLFYFYDYDESDNYIISDYDVCLYETDYESLGNLNLENTTVKVNNNIETLTYYSFSPNQSGEYRIKSNNPNSDPMVLIMDEEHNFISSFDDNDNFNYSSTMYFESDKTYYFSFFDYDDALETNISINPVFTYSDYDYVVLDNGTAEITFYNGNDATLNIPKTINGKSVTQIATNAFYYCEYLKNLTIPDSVTDIGYEAFCDCDNLISVTIPNSVLTIGYGAFLGCDSLKSVTIPKSVIEIGDRAFGYYWNYDELIDIDNTSIEKVDNFKIYCYVGTAGEQYAKNNAFNYELLSDKVNPSQRPTNTPKVNTSVKITQTTTVTKPAKVKSVKLTAKKKKLNVKWKKVSGATGYEVMYAKNNKFKGKKTIKVKKNKITLKRLKSKKKYFVKVRAYKTINGNTYYGKWSKVAKKKVK